MQAYFKLLNGYLKIFVKSLTTLTTVGALGIGISPIGTALLAIAAMCNSAVAMTSAACGNRLATITRTAATKKIKCYAAILNGTATPTCLDDVTGLVTQEVS